VGRGWLSPRRQKRTLNWQTPSLMSGKDVFVKSPPASPFDLQQGDHLVRLAMKEAHLDVGHVLEYHPPSLPSCRWCAEVHWAGLLYLFQPPEPRKGAG